MVYNFDKKVSHNVNSAKWNFYNDKNDIIEMWVADMDYEVCPLITNSLIQRVKEPNYGYTIEYNDYLNSIKNWLSKRHNWEIQNDWIISCSGIIHGLNLAIQAFTCIDDNILIQTPVYHSFYSSIKNNHRNCIENNLIFKDNEIFINFIDLEEKIKNFNIKLLILCNPHNPTGKVFSLSELKKIITLCKKYNVIIVSDEAHNDLIYPNNNFYSLGVFSNMYENIVVITSPMKTFNISGIKVANSIISNEDLRKKYISQKRKNGPTSLNLFSLAACETAYTFCVTWLDDLLNYLTVNRDYALKFITKNIPSLKVYKPQSTYFLWINCETLKLSSAELENFFLKECKIRISNGISFGNLGEYYVRLNIACNFETLKLALNNMLISIDSLLAKQL